MKKVDKNSIPKIIINQTESVGKDIYKKTSDHLEYVFDEEDIIKMSQMKFQKDILAYKQDLILRNKFKIVRKPNNND